jgi:N-acetylmuramoyl-L-alanine amidase
LGRTVAEKRVTLAVGLRALALLRQVGFRVVMSRLRDTTVARLAATDVNGRLLTANGVHRDLVARNLCANAARASVLLGIHMNAFGDRSVAGSETIYCRDRRFGPRSRHLATLVQQAVLASLQRAGWSVPDRGILDDHGTGAPALTAPGAAYGHWLELGPARSPWFRHASLMPGVIVEPLFLTNPAEVQIALSQAGQLALARGLVQALSTYFRSGRAG